MTNHAQLLQQLQSENAFLRDLVLKRESCYSTEIEFLKKELENKNNLINKLLDNNKTEKHSSEKRINIDIEKSNANEERTIIPKQVTKPKETHINNTDNKQNNNKKPTIKQYIELIGDSLLNNIKERGLKKDKENILVKVRKYPGATSTDIVDHLKPTLRKKPSEIIIHTGTNDITNDINYLNNVKKMVKLIRESDDKIKISFSGIIARKDILAW